MRQDVLKIRDAHLVEGCEELNEARRLAATVPTRDQLAEMGIRAMAVAHELRQPLFTIAIANENLRQMLEIPNFPRDRMQHAAARIDEQIQRAQEIIAGALACASGKQVALGSDDLVAAMRNTINFLTPISA